LNKSLGRALEQEDSAQIIAVRQQAEAFLKSLNLY